MFKTATPPPTVHCLDAITDPEAGLLQFWQGQPSRRHRHRQTR
jgi:hypothetical protein